MNENGDTVVTELVKILLEDCKRQEEEVMEERRRHDAESRQQLELLTRALECVGICRKPSGEDNMRLRDTEIGLKLTKLGELKPMA